MATVAIGSKVELQFGELREEWIIVDPSEADAANHKIRPESSGVGVGGDRGRG